jgi:MFS family permease
LISAAFRVRSFRFQMPADLLTSWAFEMETLILGWYVMVHTGSVLLLTVFGSLQFLGTLAAPMFGVLGDRLGGRIMLCAMRATFAILAALLMLLSLTGTLTPAWVLVVAALAGIVRPNDQVMRNSLIGETIPPAHLVGALGVSRATMDSARVAGALAGAALSTSSASGIPTSSSRASTQRAWRSPSGCHAGLWCPTPSAFRARSSRAGPPSACLAPRAGAISGTASSTS